MKEEWKKKISISNKGGNKTSFIKGYKMSEEIKRKIGIANKGKKHSKETKKRMSLYQKKINRFAGCFGENHPTYIKDRTLLKKDPRKDLDTQYKYWVKEVRTRDKNKCRLLSSECNGRLETHHIFDWIDYLELRYVLTNGITLCAFHHPRGREKEKRIIPILQELLSVSKE